MLVFAPQAPVSLERRVARVDVVVAELARKTGRDLRVRHELDDEAVFVSLRARPADELMGLLARATSARWARDGGAEWLERPADLRRRQAREDGAAFAAEAAGRFAPLLDPTDAKPWVAGVDRAMAAARSPRDPDDTLAGMIRDQARSLALRPAGRLLSRLVRRVTPAQMAAVAANHWGYLSPRPGRWEMPLLGATPASVGQYVEERNALVASLGLLTKEKADAAKQALDLFWKADAPLDAPPVLRLRFQHGVRGEARFELSVRDGAGRIVDNASLWTAPPERGGAAALPGYATWESRPVEMGPLSTSFVRSMRGSTAEPELARLAADPVANEPLALFLGESLAQLATVVGETVCALPDEAAYGAGSQLQSKPKLGEVADGLAASVAFETRDGVTIGHARRPSVSMALKTRRSALREFVAILRAGIPRLSTVARYALSQGEDADASRLDGLAIAAAGRAEVVSDTGLFDSPRDLLRAYGTLSPAQRAALAAGTPVAVGEMPPAARGCLETLLFTRDARIDLSPPSESADVCAPWIVDGLDPAATLRCPNPKRIAVAATHNQLGGLNVEEASGLGYILWQQRQGEFLDPNLHYPLVEKASFVPGTKTELDLTLRIAPNAALSARLNDLDLDLAGRAVPYGELPSELLKEARKTYDFYDRSKLGRRP